MIEVGKTYTAKELAEALGVSKSTFSHKKDQYLKSLSAAYEYDVEYKGRSTLYTITTQIVDYQKPERKRDRERTMKIFQEENDAIIAEDPIQTPANMARRHREFCDTNPSRVVQLGLKPGTEYEYTRLDMREGYGSKPGEGGTRGRIEKRIWCKLNKEYNSYTELSKEVIDDLYNLYKECGGEKDKANMQAAADKDAGLLTNEEYKELIAYNVTSMFIEAKDKFYKKYHFYPVRANVYEMGAWLDTEKV